MCVHRTCGVVAAMLGVLLASGCDDPELNTALRPEGDPEVLAILVMTDALAQLAEQATYCKPGDAFRPGLIGLPDFTTRQVCPETLSDMVAPVDSAYPDGWYVRIMFDELLDPRIEKLTPILDADTGEPTGTFSGSIRGVNPVTVECRSVVDNAFVNVDYDGYYSPSGNRVTWPVGPSIVIKPNAPMLIATGSECQVTLNASIVDKDGNPVPESQRGPFPFRVAPLKVIAIDPADDEKLASPIDALQIFFENVYVQFNTEPDPSSFCDDGPGANECEFQLSPEIGQCSVSGTACDVAKAGTDCPTAVETCNFGGYYAYTYFPFGAASEFGFGPSFPIQTGVVDDPKPYSFFFKQGGKIKDRCGVESTFGAPRVEDLTLVRFGVKEFGVRGFNLATNEVPGPVKKLQLAMNNVVDFASLAVDEWTLTPDITIPVSEAGAPCVDNSECPGAVDQSGFGFVGGGECRMFGAPINAKRCANRYATTALNDGDFVLRGHYALGTEYTFTLNAGATISDFYGVEYTNAEEVKITWTTQPAITVGTMSPANNAQIGKLFPAETTSIVLPFNQAMSVTTLAIGDDFTITPAVPTDLAVGTGTSDSSAPDCLASSLTCNLRITGTFAPGTYRFTLVAGAQITDVLGNVYTHPADTVITFTIEDAPVAQAACL